MKRKTTMIEPEYVVVSNKPLTGMEREKLSFIISQQKRENKRLAAIS